MKIIKNTFNQIKNSILLLAFITIIISCSSDKKNGNMLVKGQIKGLRKGTLYLQKMKDSVLVSVDSTTLKGTENFVLSDHIETPEMYYVTFDGNTSDKRILFFGEKGTITITDELEHFGIHPKIEGSKNQEILDKFYQTDKRFKDAQLDLIKDDFEARKNKDEQKMNKLAEDAKKLTRRRYLYTANFALNNADTEVAPYLALTELYNANIKLLDTINNSLSDKVKTSKYGKKLANFVAKIKKTEKK